LLGTLQYQVSRGKDGGLTQLDSGFWRLARAWAVDDPFLVIFGTLGASLAVLAIGRNAIVGALGLATLSLWAFMARGGEVIGFYLVPLLPLLAIGAGLLFGVPATRLAAFLSKRGDSARRAGALVPVLCLGACVALFIPGYSSPNLGFASNGLVLWNNQQAAAQRDSTNWIRTFVKPSQTLVMEAYMWTDLHDRSAGDPPYDAAHWYWKVDLDPDIRDRVLHGDWTAVDYVIGTPQMWGDIMIAVPKLELVDAAAQHATVVARFDAGGWPVEIRRADKPQRLAAPTDPILRQLWSDYTARFVNNGRVVEPEAGRQTTSSAQASALLRAVYMDDRSTFDALWLWTRSRLQTRGDGLLAGAWGPGADGTEGVLDAETSTAADQDAALALLFAAQRWGVAEYQQDALKIADGIWDRDTALVGGGRVVLAGSWAAQADPNQPVVNPSYLAPYIYRIFAQADPDHPWLDVVDSSYAILANIQASSELGGSAGLVPNWISVDPHSGALLPAASIEPTARQFTAQAGLVPWRLALDWLWFAEPRAKVALQGVSFPWRTLERDGRLSASYELDGRPATQAESISMYAPVLGGLVVSGSPEAAYRLFTDKVLRPYVDPSADQYRADPNNAQDAAWAWFASALFDGGLTNLVAGDQTLDLHAALSAR
jgi:endoglucanase